MKKSASIDTKAVLEVCAAIRGSSLPANIRRELVDELLKRIDLVKLQYTERLLCIKHAKEFLHYKWHSSIYWLTERQQRIHAFKVCCHDYFDLSELEKLPKAGPPAHLIPRKPVIKVKS